MNEILKIKANNNFVIAKYAQEKEMYDVAISRYYYYIYLSMIAFLYRKNMNITGNHYENIKCFFEIMPDHRSTALLVNNLHKLRKSRNIAEYSNEKITKTLTEFEKMFFVIYKKVADSLFNLEVLL